ncbi:hypothetical protein WA026_014474 [Henosepilachna vigintioctopunctata]|uniref:MATH domain-containing protein n=1 Tax=Henosepilachna vigintioctopunctata TaxID=420089 RepID=A0AAW1UK89_9CUCU
MTSDFAIKFHNINEATMRYTIGEFSKMKTTLVSPPCYVLNLPWKMMIIPRHLPYKDNQLKKYLGLFLQCNEESACKGWSCFAAADLKLISVEKKSCCRKIRHLFTSKLNDWGYSYFMPWCDILNTDNGFIQNDTVTLEIRFATETPGEHSEMLLDYSMNTCRVCVDMKNYSNEIRLSNETRSLDEENTQTKKEKECEIKINEEDQLKT